MASADCNMTYNDAMCSMQAEKLPPAVEKSTSCLEQETIQMVVACESAELDLSCVSVPSEDLSTFKSDSSVVGTDDLVAISTAHGSRSGTDSFHDGLDLSYIDEEAVEGISAPVSRSGRCLRRKLLLIPLRYSEVD
jgi:hypothetical protein